MLATRFFFLFEVAFYLGFEGGQALELLAEFFGKGVVYLGEPLFLDLLYGRTKNLFGSGHFFFGEIIGILDRHVLLFLD